MGTSGTSGDLERTQAEALLLEKDYVLSPLPEVEKFQSLINMKMYQAAILQIACPDGTPIERPLIYAMYLNNLSSVHNWFITGEYNKDGIFHTHALLRTGQRTDALRRTMATAWDNINLSTNFHRILEIRGCTVDVLKLQRAQKPSSLAAYMMKNPKWVMSSDDKMLQFAYDIDTWQLNARFKPKEDEPEMAPDMNQMTKELIDLIVQSGCKTIEDCMKHGPQVMSKYLHKPGLQSIVQNCLAFVKASGSMWSLSVYDIYEPDPEPIHKILLHQGIIPSTFDADFYQWITKKADKKNTFVLYGPSNTGKSAMIAGLKQSVPWGEITNGATGFNFEGIIDTVIAVWEEPLIGVELAEKCKQVFEGMTCSIPVKYKKPYMLPRTPVLITTNHLPWRYCTSEEPMFRNRMFIYNWQHAAKDEPFVCRAVECSCQCRFCKRSRSWEAAGSTAGIREMQRRQQSLSPREQSLWAYEDPTLGAGSMSGTDERASGSNPGERSSRPASPSPGCSNTPKHSIGSSSTASKHMGQFRIIRSSSDERKSGGSTKHVESNVHRGRDGTDPDGSRFKRPLGRGNGRSRQNPPKHDSPNTLGSWLSCETNPSEAPPSSKRQKVDRALAAKLDDPNPVLQIPSALDWKKYLNYLQLWHG